MNKNRLSRVWEGKKTTSWHPQKTPNLISTTISKMNVIRSCSARQAVTARAAGSPQDASGNGRRRCLITGGNTGIGFETARALAPSHDIIIGARNEAKGKAAVAKLKDAVPGASCELAVFDLADLDSVSDFSKSMLDAGTPLDVLINNAGVMACPLSRTKQGFEMQIGVNHLGHFLLTEELLPLIQAAGSNHGDARIVNLASSANYGGTMNFNDLNWRTRQYSKWPAYCQSKLANVVCIEARTPDGSIFLNLSLVLRTRSLSRFTRMSWTGG